MRRPSELLPDTAAAKQQLAVAFYDASPARIVERHPIFSVTAATSAAFAATVIVHAPLSRKLVSASVMQTLKAAMPVIQAFAMSKLKNAAATPPQSQPIPSKTTP